MEKWILLSGVEYGQKILQSQGSPESVQHLFMKTDTERNDKERWKPRTIKSE
jgi:hypothetical protein